MNKYDVFNGDTPIAKDLNLDVALSLIRGFAETHINENLTITLQCNFSSGIEPNWDKLINKNYASEDAEKPYGSGPLELSCH